ncbi:nuclear transport factor 2 family protein [Streptomyces sp. NPDC050287]|uniref:nuclear transport factor 2 family protein n=1 Tax=Streptomyces sp. NPDC050287 TaxID=3365608 RepID=UPI0037AB1CA7
MGGTAAPDAEVFSTDVRDAFVPHCLAPDVDWPHALDGVRLHGRDEVRAYWARQFAAGHPLVRLEGLGLDGDGEAVVATVRQGNRTAGDAGRGRGALGRDGRACVPVRRGSAGDATGGAKVKRPRWLCGPGFGGHGSRRK